MYEDYIPRKKVSEEVAIELNVSHRTILNWIQKGKKITQLEESFEKVKRGNRIIYFIDEAGYSYICNRYKGIKLATIEYDFKEVLIPFLNEIGLKVEYQKTILTYRVDFYIPEINTVIEYDEEYHRQKKVSVYDIKREAEIVNATGCSFLRIPANYGTIKALGYISHVLIEKCLQGEIRGTK